MTEPVGVWVYAVAEGLPATGLGQLTGVGGRPVRAITAAGLAAIASDVGLDEFGESALRANLEDMAWLEATATAHHRVIDAVARAQPVVPMRLATVYSGEGKVLAMLGQRDSDLREVLRRITARKEWGIKAYAAGPRGAVSGAGSAGSGQRPAGQRPPDQRPAGQRPAGSGAEYLRRRRDELAAGKEFQREALASAQQVHRTLSELAAASRLHPPQAPQLAGTKATMILNAAYLLDEAGEGQFSEAVRQLAGQHPAVRLQVTGPWPPYSFASLDDGNHGRVEGRQ